MYRGFPLPDFICHKVTLFLILWYEYSFAGPFHIILLYEYERGGQGSLSRENPL